MQIVFFTILLLSVDLIFFNFKMIRISQFQYNNCILDSGIMNLELITVTRRPERPYSAVFPDNRIKIFKTSSAKWGNMKISQLSSENIFQYILEKNLYLHWNLNCKSPALQELLRYIPQTRSNPLSLSPPRTKEDWTKVTTFIWRYTRMWWFYLRGFLYRIITKLF